MSPRKELLEELLEQYEAPEDLIADVSLMLLERALFDGAADEPHVAEPIALHPTLVEPPGVDESDDYESYEDCDEPVPLRHAEAS